MRKVVGLACDEGRTKTMCMRHAQYLRRNKKYAKHTQYTQKRIFLLPSQTNTLFSLLHLSNGGPSTLMYEISVKDLPRYAPNHPSRFYLCVWHRIAIWNIFLTQSSDLSFFFFRYSLICIEIALRAVVVVLEMLLDASVSFDFLLLLSCLRCTGATASSYFSTPDLMKSISTVIRTSRTLMGDIS